MATRRHIINLLDAQLAAGVTFNAAQFAREIARPQPGQTAPQLVAAV